MKGFWIGILIGLVSVGIVMGVGLMAAYFCDRGEAIRFLIVMVSAMVLISGVYGAKTL